MKALFLDVDGVLNDHRKWPNKFAPILIEHVEHLNFILEQVPDLQIVLSSAWRYRFDNDYVIEALLCCHGVNAFERVHGRTEFDPASGEDFRPYDDVEWWSEMGIKWRGDQIREYVNLHRVQRWAVLDDLPLQVDHLFRTEAQVGLTGAIAQSVVAHFGGAA